MKRQIFLGVAFGFLLTAGSFGAETQIIYKTSPLGTGRWQYDYEVNNISLTKTIEEFTIWFDFGLYENLAIETKKLETKPPDLPLVNWDEIVIQPEPVLQDDGAYDAKALGLGIGIGQIVTGFAVSFDWLGIDEPGRQFYEIIDPATYQTIDSGWTIPEPATLLLLALGGLALRRKK